LTIFAIILLSVSERLVVVGAVPCACSGGLGVVMVLNEASGGRSQQAWYARLAQERRELSRSVEETLVNTPREESFWQYDQGQCATVEDMGVGSNVFPPRLSLQSRTLPGISAHMGTGLVGTQGDTARHTSKWTRFVQRVRSSLSAFGFRSSAAIAPTLPPDESVSMQSVQVEDVLSSSGGVIDSSDSQVLSADEVRNKSERRVVVSPHVRYGVSRSTQGRQRLAGRTTRIRLEVMPAPSSAGNRQPAEEHPSVNGDSGTTSMRLPAVEKGSRQPAEERPSVSGNRGTTSMRLPAVEKGSRQPAEERPSVGEDGGTTSIRLPAIEKVVGRRKEPSSAWRAGTGKFECGQRDATLSDPSVTASSVVLVTLTANPGPVVVQYVSLQPGRGFTVHLTAPTAIGAPFNYVVLS
jgi:hypothetical protein